MSIGAVGVVIPAHDESALVGRAIRSVRSSLHAAGVERSSVVVVADACTDETAEVARRHAGPRDRVLVVDERCVGAARRTGADAALVALDELPEHVWLMSLDADSVAPTDWVARHLRHASTGVECVTGVVELDDAAPDSLRTAFHLVYSAATGLTSHPHVHGTNFGIRADVLLAAGNWPEIPTGEDHALWREVGAIGASRVQDPSLVVRTSGRLEGRAPSGFADDLRALAR